LKALTFTGVEQIALETIDDPKIIDDKDVIVRVSHCSICGSDLHVYHGRETGIDGHTAMGHEFTGEVVETGRGVKTLKIGDHIISPFSTSCGECYFCKIGLTARCIKSQLFGWIEKGRGLHGGQSEYIRVPFADATVIKRPDGIGDEESIILGDVLSTGYFCAHQAEIKPDKNYVVVGCGPVGLMAICGAIAQGAEKIFAVDFVEDRLEMARQFGAQPVHVSNAKGYIEQETSGIGADAVMDAVGSGAASRLAYQLVRPGGIISVVGVCNDANFSFSPVEAYNKNITYKVGRCPARFYLERLLPIVREKKFPLSSIFTHRLPLTDGVFAYDMFANKRDGCVKVLLRT
jgi:2-desacetyl-2-hydroxyethyl bacteriochlorophyllide A dehydrogenase